MFKERDNTKFSYIQTWNVGVDVGTVETTVINQAQRANIVSWTALKLQEQPSSHTNDWYGGEESQDPVFLCWALNPASNSSHGSCMPPHTTSDQQPNWPNWRMSQVAGN